MRRVWILIKNEVFHGPKDVVLVISIIMPVVLALFVNLAFGNIFTDRAKLGIYDENHSQIVPTMDLTEAITLKVYENEDALREATANGAVDMGIVLPADFDATLLTGTVKMSAYVWGESLAKSRAVIPVTLADAVRTVTGAELPVKIETIALGDESSVPWSDRLLPLTVLMAVFFGGMMLPASSLIHEKQQRTLEALNVSPATIGEIFIAKGMIGAVLATVMGVLTLAISGSFGNSPFALILVLALGAIMAVEIGLLCGAFIKDLNTLFAVWKFGGILLFGPAIVFMFPQIPSWVGYIFPTFYVVKPVVDLSVSGQSFSGVAVYVGILVTIIIVMALILVSIIRRLSAQALRLS